MGKSNFLLNVYRIGSISQDSNIQISNSLCNMVTDSCKNLWKKNEYKYYAIKWI